MRSPSPQRALRLAVLSALWALAGCAAFQTHDVHLSPSVAPVMAYGPRVQRIAVAISESDPFYVHTANDTGGMTSTFTYRVHLGEALRRACVNAFREAAESVEVTKSIRAPAERRPPALVVRPAVTSARWWFTGAGKHFELSLAMTLLDPSGRPVAKAQATRSCVAVHRNPFDLAVIKPMTEAGSKAMAEAVQECAEKLLLQWRAMARARTEPQPQPRPTVEVRVEEPLPPIAQRWAVIIGISEYRHAGRAGLKSLRYAARDAQRLHDRLVEGDPARWPQDNVKLLTGKQATERAVRDAILTFLKKAQRDDLVLIFFSGHGAPDPTRPKNNYFLCHDTDPENLTATGFPMWEIDNALERRIIEARRVVVLADACHSGGFAPEGMKDIAIVSRSVSEGIQKLAKRTVCRVVTSCEPGELSQEKAEWGGGHGAFAHALVKGFGGAADSTTDKNSHGNGDGKIDVDELVHYVRRLVGDLTSNAQHVQDSGRLNAVLIHK